MAQHAGFAAAAMALMLVTHLAGCSSAGSWGEITIARDGPDWTVDLANRVIYARYAKCAGNLIKDRIVNLTYKPADAVVARRLDGRHTESDPEKVYYRITDARIVYDGPDAMTVRLDFGNGQRIEHVSIFPDSEVIRIEYSSGRHNLDYGIAGDTWIIHGADAWQVARGWPDTYPMLGNEYTLHGSYYRREMGEPGPLAYRGWMILGYYGSSTGRGVGLILPADKIQWLKLIDAAGYSGFERWTTGPHTAYLYPTADGAEGIVTVGRNIIDSLAPPVH